MGWGTSFTRNMVIKVRGHFLKLRFKADIYLNRMIFHSADEVKSRINDLDADIMSAREELLMIAMANTRDLTEEGDDIIYTIRNRVNDLVERITDNMRDITLLNLYLDRLNDEGIEIIHNKE